MAGSVLTPSPTASNESIDHVALFTTSLPKRLAGNHTATLDRSGLWTYVKQAVLRTALKKPPNSRVSEVRGSRTATDSLISLCLKQLPVKKCTVFTHPELQQRARSLIHEQVLRAQTEAAVVPSLASDRIPDIDLWFDPAGATPVSLMLRQWFGRAAYPIVAVQHTMSLHNFPFSYFLPIINSPTYPWDSLVCTTNSSALAVSRLLKRTRSSGNCNAGLGFRGRIDVVPLPVDTDYFSPGDREYSRSLLGLDRRAFLILYVGSLSATKADLTPFLPILKELIVEGQCGKLKWIIAGPADARYLEYLKRQIRLMGLTDNFVFLGYVNESEKLNLYRSADVFFSPGDSLQESFGLAPVEAMACGLPQIVSDWDGYRETVIDGVTGFRIKTRWAPCDFEFRTSGFLLGSDHDHIALGQSVALDLREWGAAIKALAANSALREGMRGRSRSTALSLYSHAAVAEQHRALWSELIALRRGAREVFSSDHDSLYTARYFECFSHYASEVLTGSAQIKLTKPVRWPVPYLQEAAAFVNKHGDLIDLEICEEIVGKLSDSESGAISICSQNSGDRWLRHVLWLMKHGFVELA